MDEFGVPESLFGQHPGWFFPAVGRVVAVCALLEQRALVLAEALASEPQGSLTITSLVELQKRAGRDARAIDEITAEIGGESISGDVAPFFGRVVEVMDRRNAVVHAIWPARPGEQQFGWRPPRRGRDAATRVTIDNDRTSMTDLIGSAVALIESFPRIHGIASFAVARAVSASRWPQPQALRR